MYTPVINNDKHQWSQSGVPVFFGKSRQDGIDFYPTDQPLVSATWLGVKPWLNQPAMTGNGKFIAPINKSDDWGMVQMALFYQQLMIHMYFGYQYEGNCKQQCLPHFFTFMVLVNWPRRHHAWLNFDDKPSKNHHKLLVWLPSPNGRFIIGLPTSNIYVYIIYWQYWHVRIHILMANNEVVLNCPSSSTWGASPPQAMFATSPDE